MNIFNRLFNRKEHEQTRFQLVTERGNGVYIWDGQIFSSDTVRSCIRPTAVAVGKAVPKHIRDSGSAVQTNPEPYMRFLLEEPNPYMSCQQFLEKMARQRELSGNAFAAIIRDSSGFPCGIYPIDAYNVEASFNAGGDLILTFSMKNGKVYPFYYSDIIHLRRDFGDNDLFGTSPVEVLQPLLTVIGTVDKSIVTAVNNSSAVRWLLKYNTTVRDEDLRKKAQEFAENYLSTLASSGVAAVDSKADATQIKTDDYVPNAQLIDRTTQRFYNHFGTNAKIIQSAYNEDEWNAFYESTVEPILIDLGSEMTRKLFTRRERGCGNKIIFEASNLQYASMSTKLNLSAMVDRGAMTPNEWRAAMNKAPLPGGDAPLLRKDTATVVEPATTAGEEE